VGKSSPGAGLLVRQQPARHASPSSSQPFPYHVLVALHMHLKVLYVTLQAGRHPFLSFSRQHVNITPPMVLHAPLARVHGVRQGAPGLWFPGFRSAIKEAWVKRQARRDAALQDMHAFLRSGQSSNQRPEQNRALAPGADRQIHMHPSRS